MKKKRSLVSIIGWGIIICIVVSLGFRAIQFISALVEFVQAGIYPERAPVREFVSANKYSYLWSKKIGDGSQHLVYTQIFVSDNNNIVYITPNIMDSIDFSTGELLWSREIPEDSTFYFYGNKLFTLNSYDKEIPFSPETNINIPSSCNSSEQSTLRVYDPNTGKIEWEYSYRMVAPSDIVFKDDSAFIEGLTINMFAKFVSTFEIKINTGQILGIDCQNLNVHSHPTNPEGVLSSGYYPITRDWEWNRNTELPAFIVTGSKLVQVDRQTRQSIYEIVFSGFPLNPDATTILLQDNFLVIYLDDSNQFFGFQMK
jgi:hypothetical protein